jgi:hypothetical protein
MEKPLLNGADFPRTRAHGPISADARKRGRLVYAREIADELDEVPWDVLTACRILVRQEILDEGTGKQRGIFSIRRGQNDR